MPEQNTKQDNSWFDKGELPPVGVECEIWEFDEVWRKIKIIAHTKKGFVAEWNDMEFLMSTDRKLRPIKSDKEKFMQLARAVFCESESVWNNDGFSSFCDQMYEAGCRFNDENRSA